MYSALFRLRTLLVIMIGLFAFCMTQAADDSHGIMMVVKGDVKVVSQGKTEAAKVGRKVFPGDTIIAGPDSRAKIVMSDKNVLNISPDSKIVIEKYSNSGEKKDVEIKVEYGKVRAAVEQKYDGEKSKFNIKTPSAVAGVRGTDFITGYNAGTKHTQVITFAGTVALGSAGPGGKIENPVYVQKGQMTEMAAGAKTPEAPKAVPAEELKQMNKESGADTASNKKDGEKPVAKDDGKKDDKKEEKKDDKKEAKKEEGKKDDRKPASVGNGMGPDARDLGPETAGPINIPGNNGPAPINFTPGSDQLIRMPTNNPFVNDAIQNQKSKVIIQIQK